MSISILSTPTRLQFALHPIIYKVRANLTGVHSVEQTVKLLNSEATWAQLPDIGTGNEFTFDVREVVQDSLGYDLQPINKGGTIQAINSINFMYTEYRDKVKNGNNLVTKSEADTTENRIHVLNAGLPYGSDLTPQDYVMNGVDVRRFLCSDYIQTNTKTIRLGESEYISLYAPDIVFEGAELIIRANYISGSSAERAITLTDAIAWPRIDVGVGPANVNDLPGAAGFISEYTKSYEVFIRNGETKRSFTRTYALDNSCLTSPTRVHFLNRLGGFDSFTFNATEKKKVKTARERFQRYLPHDYTVGNRGRTVQEVMATETLLCTSDALREYERLWLEELITSPEVFIQREGKYIPVIVKDGTFDITDAQKSIFTMKVELEYAQDINIQRG